MMYVMAFAIRVSNYNFVVGGTNLDILGFYILSYSHDVSWSFDRFFLLNYIYKYITKRKQAKIYENGFYRSIFNFSL